MPTHSRSMVEDDFYSCYSCSFGTDQRFHTIQDGSEWSAVCPSFRALRVYTVTDRNSTIAYVNEYFRTNSATEGNETMPVQGTAREIRAWAIRQGYYIASTGPIPAYIRQDYRRANRPAPIPITPAGTLVTHYDGDDTLCVHSFLGRACTYENHYPLANPVERGYCLTSEYYGDAREGAAITIIPGGDYYLAADDSRNYSISTQWGYYGDRYDIAARDVRVKPRAIPCAGCGGTRHRAEFVVNGAWYCSSCVVRCDCHGTYFRREGNPLVVSMGTYRCVGSEVRCPNCQEVIGDEYGRHPVTREYVCSACIPRCETCGSILNERSRCDNCRRQNRARNVRGYGHTTPTMWLGADAPDEKTGTYFLGFELEVSAGYDDATEPIKTWAWQHLGNRDALDLKEDSSVQGFEIVSMPMTPEYFEGVDWDSFFQVLNTNLSAPRVEDEPDAHGLHVHISRTAFKGSASALAAYCYLLSGNSSHLERISRRAATHYCSRINTPVSQAVNSAMRLSNRVTKQSTRISYSAKGGLSRGAVNLNNANTVEVRAGKSTRTPAALAAQVRLTYLAAEYVRAIMAETGGFIPPKALIWESFANWVGSTYPEFHSNIAGN